MELEKIIRIVETKVDFTENGEESFEEENNESTEVVEVKPVT